MAVCDPVTRFQPIRRWPIKAWKKRKLEHAFLYSVLPLYTFLKVLYFFLRKSTFYTFFILFSWVNTFKYFFFAKNGQNFTFKYLMSALVVLLQECCVLFLVERFCLEILRIIKNQQGTGMFRTESSSVTNNFSRHCTHHS